MFERIEVASPNRPWTTALAFLLNATFLTAAILLPLIKPDRLPALNFRTVSLPYTAQQPEEPAAQPMASHRATAAFRDTVFRAPSSIPIHAYRGADPDPGRPLSDPAGPGWVDRNGIGVVGLPMLPTANPPAMTRPVPRATATVFQVSHLDEGMLVRRVQPVYPVLAVASRTEGTVVLSALIGTNGEIEHLSVVSGHPLLARAALEAVSQWRYRPYVLNGVPIEVQTQINVNFNLQR